MNRKAVGFTFLAIYIAYVVFYLARVNHHVEAFIFLLPSLLACLLGFYAANTYKLENIHGRSLAFMAAGLGFFFAGETMFYLYDFVFHKNPFPSIADLFYLIAYPLILTGLLIEVKMHKPKLSEFNKSAVAVMSAVLIVAIAAVTYFGIYKAYDASASGLANFIALSYGVADLIILVPVMYVLKLAFDFKGGKLFNSWILIFFAIVAMLVGDILFASYNTQYSEGTWPYNLIDLAWAASYLLFGFSFLYTALVLKELRKKLIKPKD